MKKEILLFLFVMLAFFSISAQSDIPIGTWKSHLAYKEGTWVTASDHNIYYAAAKGLFIINKDDFSVRFLSKEDGLSDVSIDKIYFDRFNDQLIIIYSDSNIDILRQGDEIINISAIRDNRTIIGSKTIRELLVVNQNLAYLATDFGIISFHLSRLEFVNTTFTPFAINGMGSYNNNIIAATQEGLYYIPIQDANPADFGRWIKMTTDFNLPDSYSATQVKGFGSEMYAVVNNRLMTGSFSEPFVEIFTPEPDFDIIFLSAGTNYLLVGTRNYDQNRSYVYTLTSPSNITSSPQTCLSRMRYAIEEASGRLWFADEWGPIKYAEQITSSCSFLDYNSPLGNQTGEINFKNNDVFIAGGGITEDYQNPAGSYGLYIFKDKTWTNYNRDNIPELGWYDMAYIQTVVPHPKKNEIYVGSYWNGLLKWSPETGAIEHYNKDNSDRFLLPRVGDTLRTRVPFMTFDNKENLWICNFGSSKPLVVWTKDGQWQNFSVPGNSNLAKITIDKNQNKWMAVQGVGNGLLVFNEGDDIFDTSDDQSRYITSANSEIKANRVHTVFSDLNGSVWVGTSEGPVIFDCQDPFSDNCTGATRKVIEDGIPAILLKTEEILSIAADGANRKWLGTRNGIFVLSPSGDTLITKFDTKNSPLLDNVVRYLSYNGESGEMWISSNNGLQSYRTTTTSGGKLHDDVYIFPNPVRPEYQGPIAINGLVRDANVKITDVNGRLVYETTAEGGQAIWFGKDYLGNNVVSGVYLVFSSVQEIVDNPDAHVAKILIIR